MSGYQTGILVLAVLTIIFNAGGFVWLAKNHMKHVQDTLDRMSERLSILERTVARIEGKLYQQ